MSQVPVSIDLERAQVELLDLRSSTFNEPFFGDTVERTRRECGAGVPLVLDLLDFVRLAQCYPTPPDALLFHVGRCGSTLLTNMLVRGGDYVAVKEPEILNDLVSAWLASPEDQRRHVEALTAATLRILLGAIESPRRRILKLAAWNVQMATSLLAMFPKTPAAFVFRSPYETVASQLHNPPAWFDIIDASRGIQARYFPSIIELPRTRPIPPTALFAHAWRSAVEAAQLVPTGRLVYVGYEALIEDPSKTLRRLLDHWGRPNDDDTLSRMLGALSINSKDPEGRERFDPLGSHHRPSLSGRQWREVNAVAGYLWRQVQWVPTAIADSD